METYWSRARRLAWGETAKLLGIDSPGRTMFRVIAAALVVVGVWNIGSAEAWSSHLIGKVLATAVVLGALPLVFAWKLLITAPPKLIAEETSQAAALTATIADLQRATEPVLEFVDPGDMASAKLRSIPEAIVHRICVRNASSTTKLDDVEVNLVATDEPDGTRRAVGERLCDLTGATKATITPEAKRYFEVLFVRPNKNPPRLYLAPHGTNGSQHTRGPGLYRFEIEATSATTRPLLSRYQVEMGSNGKVRITLHK